MTSTERRQYQRQALRYQVLVVARGFNPVSGEMGNVCAGGMWLENLNSPELLGHLAQTPESPLEIHLFLTGSGREVHTRILAHVRRVGEGSIGVQFARPDPALVAMLTEQPVEARRSPLIDDSHRQVLWADIRRRIPVLMDNLLGTFVEASGDLLQQRQETSSLLREVNQLREARQLLIEQQGALRKEFMAQVNELLGRLGDTREKPTDQDPLRVVDKILFEDWLALQMIATGVASRHRNVLFRFNQLLSQVALREISDRSNPLAPIALCQCLQYALVRLRFESSVRLLLYRGFEAALEHHWRNDLEHLSDRLTAGGLRALDLENLPANWSLRGSSPPPKSDADTTAQPPEHTDTQTTQSARPDEGKAIASGSVLRLIGLYRDAGHGGTPGDADSVWPVERLQPLRADLRQALSGESPSIEQALDDLMEEDHALKASLNPVTRDRVRLADQLFAPLDRQARLSDTLRDHLHQLRLPVLQILLETPAFLDDESHPAREIVNNLMRLCLADRASSKNLERTVTEVVNQLLDADSLDESLFQQIGERLNALVSRQDQSFLRNAERIAKTQDGKLRLKQTR